MIKRKIWIIFLIVSLIISSILIVNCTNRATKCTVCWFIVNIVANRCDIKGNIKSKIYHTKDSPNFNTINASNVWCFETEQDARSYGFRKFKTK